MGDYTEKQRLNCSIKDYKDIYDKYRNDWCIDDITTPIVSVVVPAYNVEHYIEDCLGSLLKQTFKNFEVIIINDGSSDLTPEIANVFQHYDKRFKLITQENGGVSKARNVGISQTCGQYICFLDADDWIDENYLECLYDAITRNDCDIAVSSIIRTRKKTQKFRVYYTEEKIYKALKDKIDICNIPKCCYACGKLFKTNLIKNKLFEEDVYFEDVIWIPQILNMSDKLVTVPNIRYWYRVNKNSIVKMPSKKKQFDSYKAKKFLINYLSERGIEFSNKTRTLTKEVIFFAGIPLLKIKECDNILTTLFFGIVPVFREKIPTKLQYKNLRKFLLFKNLDKHYYIELFKLLKISIKNRNGFKNYSEARKYGLETNTRKTKLIVSLTSFPERINTVYITINTLLNQTVKPDKLILWLAESQFHNREQDLPKELLRLKDYGLEIKWCEDLKSYKKLIPVLKEYPNDIIVTADDDLYYQRDWLESLYNAYLDNPKYVYTRRACGVKLKNNTITVNPHYANKNYSPTYLNQLMGGAGTLYPPNSLYKDVLNENLIKSLILTHDDIYFWIMAILKGTKVCLIKNKDVNIYNVENTQEKALCKQHCNNSEGMCSDVAFAKILEYYPQAFDLLEKESL